MFLNLRNFYKKDSTLGDIKDISEKDLCKVEGKDFSVAVYLGNDTRLLKFSGNDKFAVGFVDSTNKEEEEDDILFGITWNDMYIHFQKHFPDVEIDEIIETEQFRRMEEIFIETILLKFEMKER